MRRQVLGALPLRTSFLPFPYPVTAPCRTVAFRSAKVASFQVRYRLAAGLSIDRNFDRCHDESRLAPTQWLQRRLGCGGIQVDEFRIDHLRRIMRGYEETLIGFSHRKTHILKITTQKAIAHVRPHVARKCTTELTVEQARVLNGSFRNSGCVCFEDLHG